MSTVRKPSLSELERLLNSEDDTPVTINPDGTIKGVVMSGKPILVLDFDGVINGYQSGWCGAHFIPDPPVPGAFEFMLLALNEFEVKILSSRSHQEGGIPAMMAYIEYWARKELPSGYAANKIINQIAWRKEAFPLEKPPAFVTIDDRALTFDGTWPSMDTIRNFKPWNKK